MSLYNPLPDGSKRLLRLLPRLDEHPGIRCKLVTCDLLNSGNTHPYEALSYVWGTEDNGQCLYIDNFVLPIKANLHAALLHLRDRFTERVLWIDAVCINQDDIDERGRQVQSMTEIYAKANCVIVWLGEAADGSDQALEIIRKAVGKKHTDLATDEMNEQAIIILLRRPWFQRIWVVQEVAAARYVLIKCGLTEINGYTFCTGLSPLNLSYETYPDLRGLIPSVIYLLQLTNLRPGHGTYEFRRSGRFYLDIRPLGELLDMYHIRKATECLDKVYALLGMSSNDPSTVGLLPDYRAPWKGVFQKAVKFSLSDQVSVDTWDENEVAVINGKACVIGEVALVATRGDIQILIIQWEYFPGDLNAKSETSSPFTSYAPAKLVQEGDIVCLLQGASTPTIIRPCNDYFAVMMIAAPLVHAYQITGFKWSELLQSITFPIDIQLVWDWDISGGKPQDGEDYEYLMRSRGIPMGPRTALQNDLDKSVRLWNSGPVLRGIRRHEDAEKNMQEALSVCEAALKSVDNLCLEDSGYSLWTRAETEALRVVVDLLIKEKDGYALKQATRNGQEAIVELLLATDKVDLDFRDSFDRTPLSWAAEHGHETVVRLLLGKGAALDIKDSKSRTPLSWAAVSGHETVVRLLLDKGATIEARDEVGLTPLSLAAASGYETVVRLLLDKGAAIETKDKDDRTPTSWAAEQGHEAVVRLLLGKGAALETKDRNSRTPLSLAAGSGHETVVQQLLDEGAAFETMDKIGRTPLSWAAERGRKNVVQLLLSKGATIETKDRGGQTPLLRAIWSGHETVVQQLLDEGAAIETRDRNGRTPLSLAAESGHENIVRLLLDKGAALETTDKIGRTLLSWAAERGHNAILRLLLDKGATIDARDRSGRTPLSRAAGSGNETVVQLLLGKGATIETEDKNGRTPLSWAAIGGHEAVVNLLKSPTLKHS